MARYAIVANNANGASLHLPDAAHSGHAEVESEPELRRVLNSTRSGLRWDSSTQRYVRNSIAHWDVYRITGQGEWTDRKHLPRRPTPPTTAALNKARAAGASIVCDVAPYNGHPVAYQPRHAYDPQPWTLGPYRYSGTECRVEKPQ